MSICKTKGYRHRLDNKNIRALRSLPLRQFLLYIDSPFYSYSASYLFDDIYACINILQEICKKNNKTIVYHRHGDSIGRICKILNSPHFCLFQHFPLLPPPSVLSCSFLLITFLTLQLGQLIMYYTPKKVLPFAFF